MLKSQRILIRLLAPAALALIALVGPAGCTKHTIQVQPIRIEPIYMTIDVNVKVDRELDEFFDYKDKPQLPAPPAEAPAASEAEGEQP